MDRASALIKAVTGASPRYVRPPDWISWPELSEHIAARGYHVMTISSAAPLAWRDINSVDYLCAGTNPRQCPAGGDEAFVLREIAAREKLGVTTHILTFHELSTTTLMLQRLIPQLKRQGYRFVTLQEYAREVGQQAPARAIKRASAVAPAKSAATRRVRR